MWVSILFALEQWLFRVGGGNFTSLLKNGKVFQWSSTSEEPHLDSHWREVTKMCSMHTVFQSSWNSEKAPLDSQRREAAQMCSMSTRAECARKVREMILQYITFSASPSALAHQQQCISIQQWCISSSASAVVHKQQCINSSASAAVHQQQCISSSA